MKEKKKEKKLARKEEFKRQDEGIFNILVFFLIFSTEKQAEKKKKNKKKGKETEEEKKAKAELELLMMDEDGKKHKKGRNFQENSYRKGYNLQSLIEDDDDGKKSKKKKRIEKKQEEEFQVDVQDERFQQMFSNPQDYGIDPTHKRYPFLILLFLVSLIQCYL
jgi:uncharacterized membrane protein